MTDWSYNSTANTWVPPTSTAPVVSVVALNPVMTVNEAGDTLTITVTLRDGTVKTTTLALV